MHNVIVTNQKLALWKIIDSNMCTFCRNHVETTMHLFWECNFVQKLWDDIQLFVESSAPQQIITSLEWTPENIMFNRVHSNAGSVINFVTLITKQHIYKQRCANRQLYSNLLIQEIHNIMMTEHAIARSKGKLSKHYSKWSKLYAQIMQTEQESNQQADYVQLYIQQM